MISICYYDEESTKRYFPHLEGELIRVTGNSEMVYSLMDSSGFSYFGREDETGDLAEVFISLKSYSEFLDFVIIYNNWRNELNDG